eukprot:TRINITY_DN27612_c0_g1_i1.p1 TRINITY_DN27612_c0_g1~~TRINITY_DN27612_c0_g1_i1.p1  ORF type:complete len:239 (+),score=56.89 TRINITY_DN27612_c0_g1_i1:71-718(+)
MVANRQPIIAHGQSCIVYKHSSMACAFVTFSTEATRELVLKVATSPAAQKLMEQIDKSVFVERRADKATGVPYAKDIFVAWKGSSDKSAMKAQMICEVFDTLFFQAADLVNMRSAAPQPTELPACKLSSLSPDVLDFQPSECDTLRAEFKFDKTASEFKPSRTCADPAFIVAFNSALSSEGKPLAYSPVSSFPPRRFMCNRLCSYDEHSDNSLWL